MNTPEAPQPNSTPTANDSPPASPVETSTENFPLGLAAGLSAAVLGGAAWAAVTLATDYRIGLMAVGVGFLAGYAVRTAGKGASQRFAVAGGLLALLGCMLGNYFTVIGVFARQQHLGFFTLLMRVPPNIAVSLMADTFQPMDALFYGIAVYEGFKFGRVKPSA